MQLKALQHELGCKNGILMSRKLDLEVALIFFKLFQICNLPITDTETFLPREKENQQHLNLERYINPTVSL